MIVNALWFPAQEAVEFNGEEILDMARMSHIGVLRNRPEYFMI